MKRTKRMIAISMAAAMLFPTTAFAGTWQGADGSYKYQNDDGTYAKGGWHWIDGNGDGVSESYYFNEDGMLLQNTTTPDNYQVDASGAWVVDGVVQTKIVGASAVTDMSQRNEEAPLAHLKDYFVRNANGEVMWKWDADYLWEIDPDSDNRWNEQYHHTGTSEIIMQDALAMDSMLPLSGCFPPRELIAVAELAGISDTGRKEYADANRGRIDALKSEIVAFMNSFDWRNASDFEKAVRISERIARADYYDDTTYSVNDFGQTVSDWGDASTAIGCLVDGKCNCGGYSSAAGLLANCVNLVVSGDIIGNHGFPIYRVNGVWVRHEPTTKDRFFRVFDWEESKYGSNKEYYSGIAEFCERSGYQTPTNEEVLAAFPGKAHLSGKKVTIYFD